MTLQGTALKETFEETGLQVRITGIVGDFEKTTSVVRLYRARRMGGSPLDMGWETQALHLCPRKRLKTLLNAAADQPIAAALE